MLCLAVRSYRYLSDAAGQAGQKRVEMPVWRRLEMGGILAASSGPDWALLASKSFGFLGGTPRGDFWQYF